MVTKYTIEGTPENIFRALKSTFGEELDDQELRLLFSLEMKSIPDYTPANDDGFWLYEDAMPATLLAGNSGYSITVYETCSDIIKKIIKYAAAHVVINNSSGAGVEFVPEQNAFKNILFIGDILYSIYKKLYKLKDYEWCFCFSAASYLKNNNTASFSAEDVLNVLHQNMEMKPVCLHIGENVDCTWKTEDYCRLNKETVEDVIKHLCDNKVIIETYSKSKYYTFVM